MSMQRTCSIGLAVLLLIAGSASAITVTTATGNGADTALENDGQSGNHGPASLHGTEASLTVRRFDGTRQKMPYLRFDLTGIEGDLTKATLTFNITSTANRARVWGVYGLMDETLDNWDEATICYNNAPGLLAAAVAAYTIDTGKMQKLGTMNVGSTAGLYTSVPAELNLDSFLAKDTNKLVTFLVIPDTTDTTATWYVSSKESTTPELAPALAVPNASEQVLAAYQPVPAKDAQDVSRDVVLSWKPGQFAGTHNVYLGSISADVDAANVADPRGVLVSQGQTDATYDPPGHLTLGQTCYWRVDEVNATPDGTIYKGPVWNFTVEPYSYRVTNVTATASSFGTDAGPQNTVDGSGLDTATQTLHSTLDKAMWLSAKNTPLPAWIQYAFDQTYKLHEMWVWNYNISAESLVGLGCKLVTVEYSVNGTDWLTLGDFEFAQGPSADGYAHNTTIDFNGVAARYVKLTPKSNWGGVVAQCGLSEVRFFYIPAHARGPAPAPGTTNVDPTAAALSWRAGREAASHDVYISADRQAVADGTALAASVADASYAPTSLGLAATYYWKVVEVNQVETPSAWESDIWSFSTLTYLTVDDFESYTNESPNRVFQTWVDGAGFSPDEFFPNGNDGNGSGALVGYDPTLGDIMETGTVHGGRQAMPLSYDNSAAPRYSEAVRTFAEPQDWSGHGITTLTLYFRGDVNNAPAPVYVKINNAKVVYNNGAAATTSPVWKQWNIDLASATGANLTSVRTLAVGAGDGSSGGAGTLFIDDILLYAAAPQVVAPADPGVNGLMALYAMEGNVQDTSGKGNNGTASGDPVYGQGLTGLGKALGFDGVNDYVDLPIGSLLSTLNSSSFAAWVYFNNVGNAWQRIFDFGNPGVGTASPNVYMFLSSNNGSRIVRFAIRNATVGEQIVNGLAAPTTGWHHVAVVIDSASMTLRLYQDGILVRSGATTVLPKDMGVTTQNWLGRSQYTADPYFGGAIDEFRTYNRALSESEVRYLAGER